MNISEMIKKYRIIFIILCLIIFIILLGIFSKEVYYFFIGVIGLIASFFIYVRNNKIKSNDEKVEEIDKKDKELKRKLKEKGISKKENVDDWLKRMTKKGGK